MRINKINLKRIILFNILFFSFLFCQVDTAWVRRYDGGSMDWTGDLIVDRTGNVYVTGWCYNINYTKFVTIKYDAYGNILWVASWNYGEFSLVRNPRIAIDSLGNVYITGEILDHRIPPPTPSDYLTLKYNSDGVLQWFRIYDNPGKFDVPQAIAIDNFNNIYVTGWGDNLSCFLTIKYNSNGEVEWIKRDSSGKWASGIAVSKDNYIYVTGWSEGSYITIKYNSNGNKEWEVNYPAHAFYLELPKIAIDTSSNVYVAGVCNNDYLTIKYNRNGQILWVRTYNGPVDGYDRICGLAVDNLGNIYVTGLSEGHGTNFDYATIKYNANGVEEWVKRYNGSGNGPDSARAIAVDDSGNVYVTGASWNGFNMDYLTIKYAQNPDRVEEWIIRYNGPDNLNDYAYFLSTDNYGNIYVSGISYSAKQGSDYTTIKYIQTGCGIRTEERRKFLLNNSILKTYPNPAKNIVYIQGPLFKKEIKIFDISGNLIKVFYIEENKKRIYFNLNSIKEGIYFIKIDDKQEKLIVGK